MLFVEAEINFSMLLNFWKRKLNPRHTFGHHLKLIAILKEPRFITLYIATWFLRFIAFISFCIILYLEKENTYLKDYFVVLSPLFLRKG